MAKENTLENIQSTLGESKEVENYEEKIRSKHTCRENRRVKVTAQKHCKCNQVKENVDAFCTNNKVQFQRKTTHLQPWEYWNLFLYTLASVTYIITCKTWLQVKCMLNPKTQHGKKKTSVISTIKYCIWTSMIFSMCVPIQYNTVTCPAWCSYQWLWLCFTDCIIAEWTHLYTELFLRPWVAFWGRKKLSVQHNAFSCNGFSEMLLFIDSY